MDTPLKTKILPYVASENGMIHLYVFAQNLLHFWFTLQDGKIFGSISYKNPAILRLLDLENSGVWMVLPQFVHNSYLCVIFWVHTFDI